MEHRTQNRMVSMYDSDKNERSLIKRLREFWIKTSDSKFRNLKKRFKHNAYTVKPVYNDHPRDTKFVAVVYKWSLFRGFTINV
jgi:hypothetical protein